MRMLGFLVSGPSGALFTRISGPTAIARDVAVMAESESQPDATQPDRAAGAGKPPGLLRRLNFKWLVGPRLLGTVAICSLALNVVGYGFIKARMSRTPPPPSPEIEVGTFQFQTESAGKPGIVSARFNLHVNLLKEAERAGRAQLVDSKFRLQQDLEELLRRAHSADFEDPALAELKRQMQEQVNATLGMKAVSNVIITDLALQRAEASGAEIAATETADASHPQDANHPQPVAKATNSDPPQHAAKPTQPPHAGEPVDSGHSQHVADEPSHAETEHAEPHSPKPAG